MTCASGMQPSSIQSINQAHIIYAGAKTHVLIMCATDILHIMMVTVHPCVIAPAYSRLYTQNQTAPQKVQRTFREGSTNPRRLLPACPYTPQTPISLKPWHSLHERSNRGRRTTAVKKMSKAGAFTHLTKRPGTGSFRLGGVFP